MAIDMRICAPYGLMFILVFVLPFSCAHGEDKSMADMHMDGMIMTNSPQIPTQPSYFSYSEHSGIMYAHIGLMVLAWVIVLPAAVMLSIARTRSSFLVQIIFAVLNISGIAAGAVYNANVPNLYENNSHHKVGWAVTWISAVWVAMGFVRLCTKRPPSLLAQSQRESILQHATQEHHKFSDMSSLHKYCWLHDSGHGTEQNTDSLCGSSRTQSINSETAQFPLKNAYEDGNEDEVVEDESQGFLQDSTVNRVFSNSISQVAMGRATAMFSVTYVVLERFMPLLAFVAILTGFVVYGGIFRAENIFNGLAHFIKGGIFFWYGLLTFGRWMGCFAEFGWAWNVKPSASVVGRTNSRIPNAEFTESFVIFFYGASNVFLEHLAAWGKAWTAMDLEHVSITIMFFGGGLLGMFIESTTIRKFLSSTFMNSEKRHEQYEDAEKWDIPKLYVHPLNPMPALVILLLGIMMSSHTQHSAVSSAIHKQWGTLFSGFALARGLTYVIFWLKPPTSYLPSRPPTEIITSFCLISGGAIFMVSNRDTVMALEQYRLDAMFVFTVAMGVTAMLMAWVIFLVALKGWAVQKHSKVKSPLSA